MYQAIYYDRSTYTYHLRDDEKGWLDFKYTPELYQIVPNGPLETLDGKRAKPVDKYEWRDTSLYEQDVDKCTRVLIDLYKDSDEGPKQHNIVYFDIECEIGGTLTADYIKSAPMKMTSVALYDNTMQKWYCLILDEKNQITPVTTDTQEIRRFNTEADMLLDFLNLWEYIDPTIITGWNSGFFDVPYMYYRMCNVLGKDQAARLSPLRKLNFTEWDTSQPIELGGINHLDYMLLFKKYIVKQEPSYKLDDIGEKYVKMNKIEYEGSLDKLFQTDINKYIQYNLRDVEIIVELEKKLKFIDLTVAISHLCHVPYEQIYLSTVLNDGAILTYLKRQDIVSPNKPTTINPSLRESTNDEYAGGYLKDPIPGLYQWVIDLDFTSLYPSIIRSLNIGIETLVGRIVNNGKYDNQWTYEELLDMDQDKMVTIEKLNENFTTSRTQVSVSKIVKMIESNKWITAASGAIFRTDKSSVVCEVLTDWFNKRKHYKKLMSESYKKGDATLGEYYNRLQHAYKIKLNDIYGCYAINGWRYTDGHKMISSAITLTGQRLLQESIKNMNRHINKLLGTADIDHIITSDTDSLFIQVKDILKLKGIDLTNREACIKATLEIASELQVVANTFIGEFAKKSFNIPGDREHYFELKQEVVIERSYHSGKRRYAMLIVNKEGVDTEEMIMMGLDLMKSNMPPLYKKFGQNLLKEIMSGKPKAEVDRAIVEFKSSLDKMDWNDLAKPTGVKQINSYIAKRPAPGEIFSEFKLKAPVNTKAAVYYNDLLKFKRLDKKYSLFTEGDKMKYVSLKPNPFNIDVLGFRGVDDPEFIVEFIDKYVDREDAFNSVLLNKLTGVYEDIKWDFPVLNAKINKFFKFM
jgi:DNA polymerase elongation subunit (family B)